LAPAGLFSFQGEAAMNEATERLDEALAEIRSGVEGAFANPRPRMGFHTPEPAAPVEPEPEPPAVQTAPEDEAPPVPTSMLDWIYLLHGQLAYLDANMLRIERFLGMGDRPAEP
jgi:outer membrane biosynthesis protein TonB